MTSPRVTYRDNRGALHRSVVALVLVGFASSLAPFAAAQTEPPAEQRAGEEGEEEPGQPQQAADTPPANAPAVTPFAQLIAEAFSDHPAVERRRAEVRVEQERARDVGIRPDPSVRLSVENIPWDDPTLSESPMSGVQLMVSQPIWWPGELDALREEAEARAQALEPLVDEEQVDILVEAAELYFEIDGIDRTIEALEARKGPVREFIELLERRIGAGEATVAQVERARLELLRIDDQIFALRYERPERVARLNALLNRPDDSPVHPTEQAPVGGIEESVDQALAPLDALVERGMQNRPALVALERRQRAARAAARAASWETYPDLRVFGGWRFRAGQQAATDTGSDFVSLGLQSTLPFWSRERATAAEDVAQARVLALDAAIEEFRLELRGQISSRLARINQAVRRAAYYRDDLIPQAIQARRAARAGLQAGRAAYEDWLQAEQRVVEMQTRLVEFDAIIRQQRAAILVLTGAFFIS